MILMAWEVVEVGTAHGLCLEVRRIVGTHA
jgi:hypothetical protein